MSKVKASNGYIIIYVGKDHHLADIRGYAYEHRLVAEKKIGRKLRKGEHVHHIDHNKENNDPSNLEVVKSFKYHRFLHRKKDSNLKLPDKNNYRIKCACGCGKSMMKFDDSNRPRKYITGHNPPKQESMDAIFDAIQKGNKTIDDIRKYTGKGRKCIRTILCRMVKRKMIVRVFVGEYGPLGTPKFKNKIIKCACGCGEKFKKYDEQWRERKYISGHNGRKSKK